MKLFETFDGSSQINFKPRVNSSRNFVSVSSFMKYNSSILFWLKQYILCLKGAHWNEHFWDFRVLRSKFVKFLMSLWYDESIHQQILYLSSVSAKITLLYLFSSNNIDFAQNYPIKMKIFQSFECLGQNLSNFICQFGKDKSIPLQILCLSSVSWKIIPLFFFSSRNQYFAQN